MHGIIEITDLIFKIYEIYFKKNLTNRFKNVFLQKIKNQNDLLCIGH